jgi:glycosyltransferase involved in cell wall biosynthesis
MNENPKITIVTPSYNQGQFIEETILSVLNQTYPNIEYILVDGGSTDKTMEIVNRYKDRIDLVISEKDNGQSDAINKGFKRASGELAGWVNSDDLLYPECVEKIVELYRQHPGGSIYYPAFLDYIDREGKRFDTRQRLITDKNYLLNKDCVVIQPGSFYDRKALQQVGYVDEDIYYCMDLDLWLRLLEIGKIYYYNGHALSALRKWEETKTALGAEPFLQDIFKTLNKYGGRRWSKAQLHTEYIRWRIRGGKVKRWLLNKKK